MPQLVIVDGGKTQVSAAMLVMKKFNIFDIPIFGVAKGKDRTAGKEEIYRENGKPFTLKANDPILYFIQRIRDEAHRFAIGTHRLKRS